MKSAKNIIDKIFLDFTYKVSFDEKQEALEETKTHFYNNLLPKIDLLLSKYSNNSTIRINTLTIDLDKISLADLPEKLVSELETELAKHLQNPLWVKQTAENTDQKENEDLDTLIYFLQTGTLPWHHAKNVLPEKLFEKTLKTDRITALGKLKQIFKTDKIVLERFILQFTNEQVKDVFTWLSSENKYGHVLAGWYKFISTAKQQTQILRTFVFAIKHQTVKNEIEFLNDFVDALLLPYLNADRSVLPQIVSELKTVSSKDTPSEKTTALFKTIEKDYSEKKYPVESDRKPTPAGNERLEEETPITRKHNKSNKEDINSFAVDNAGLVILFPYLQMFFSEVGLMKGEEFSSTAGQLKAVQMLQYLATGSVKTPEHLLALNKALCGVDLAMPCPGTLRLTKAQKQMCETLLNAVINNWPPLKGTSIAGFRQSFLQRNGTVKKDDDNWTLHVERKAFDILFEQLPWGFSVVKFPWTEYFIHVQW